MALEIDKNDTDYKIMLAFKRRYGRKYRFGKDLTEDGTVIGYYIDTTFRPKRRAEDGEFPCGVWEYGDGVLAALIPGRTARAVVRKYPFVELYLETDEGHVLLFPADKLDMLADVLKLRRRRKLSPEQRKQAAERLSKYQFKSHVRVI